MSQLTNKQAAFVKLLPACGWNATEAAKKAGCTAKSARVTASKWLTKANIQNEIAKAQRRLMEKTGRAAEDVVADIREVTKRCMQHVPVLDKKGQRVYVETPEGELAPAYAFDAKNALRGLELEGKHKGIFTEQLDINMKRDILELSDDELDAFIARFEIREGNH